MFQTCSYFGFIGLISSELIDKCLKRKRKCTSKSPKCFMVGNELN